MRGPSTIPASVGPTRKATLDFRGNVPEFLGHMAKAAEGTRSTVRVGYDGAVYKTFLGSDAKERFENECRVLEELEARGCDFVPRLLRRLPEALCLVTTHGGAPAENLPEGRAAELFLSLREDYGVVHGGESERNVTFDPHRGKHGVIDFESASILGSPIGMRRATTLTWAGYTQKGARKDQNEDSHSVFRCQHGCAAEEPDDGIGSIENEGLIFAVSDGMGGHAGGAVASSLVIAELHRYLPARLGNFTGCASPLALIESAIQSLHWRLLRVAENRPEFQDMGATVVCALFFHGELHFGHVGDSRLYRFRRGVLHQLTVDHSFVGDLVHRGRLDERQARFHPRKNVLSQAVGARCHDMTPQLGVSSVNPGDWFLVCSDGIVDGLWDKHIEQAFLMASLAKMNPHDVVHDLVDRSVREVGRDDTTAFVIRAD